MLSVLPPGLSSCCICQDRPMFHLYDIFSKIFILPSNFMVVKIEKLEKRMKIKLENCNRRDRFGHLVKM